MKKILVTGATGKLGTIVLKELLDITGSADISVMVRDPLKAEHLISSGIEVLRGDYGNTASLLEAFQNKDKVYFISSSDKADRFKQHQNVVDAAVKAGIGHLFYTSAHRGSDNHDSLLTSDAHWQTDELIKQSGLTYTILKHSLYSELLPLFMSNDILDSGKICLPAAAGRASYATREDLARAGVAALTTTGHENKVYELSDTASYCFEDIAKILSELSGRKIQYFDIEEDLYIETLNKKGISGALINGILHFCHALKAGEFDFPSQDIEMLTGFAPTTMRSFLKLAYNL